MPSSRSGLSNLFKEAREASRLLVISRVANQKILPWMVSSTGAVRCFDTVSLSQKLSLHRHAKVSICLHVFLWNRSLASSSGGQTRFKAPTASVLPLPPEVQLIRQPNESQRQPLPHDVQGEPRPGVGEGAERRLERDTAGDLSFRFHDFALSSNWV